MRVILRFLFVLMALLAVTTAEAATKKKKVKPPEKPKAAYELPMKVVIVRSSEPGCEPTCPEWIMADGEITPVSPAQFRKALKQAGKRKLPVVIRSPGGHVTSALEISRMIRKAGLDVAVGWTDYSGCAPADKSCELPKDQDGIYRGIARSTGSGGFAFCNSACPFILMAGNIRLSGLWAYVATHQVRTKWTRERVYYRERYKIVKGKRKVVDRKITSRKALKSYETVGLDNSLRKKLTAYLKEMGIDQAFLAEMDKAPPTSLFQLKVARQLELKVITASLDVTALTGKSVCALEATGEHCVLRKPEEKAVPNQSAMRFDVVRSSSSDCEPLCPQWIAARGRIDAESPAGLAKVLADAKEAALPIVLDSDGGDFDSALALGRMIRAKGLDTAVAITQFAVCAPKDKGCTAKKRKSVPFEGALMRHGNCSAACVFVLAGGVHRFTAPVQTTEVVHPSALTSASETPVPDQIEAYFKDMLPDTSLLQFMRNAAVAKPVALTSAELKSAGLADNYYKAHVFSDVTRCLGTPAANCVARN